MAIIRSGLPRDWLSCLEKPGAGRCGKWFFGSAAELLNLWTVSPRHTLSQPELGSFLEQGEASRANRQDSQSYSSAH